MRKIAVVLFTIAMLNLSSFTVLAASSNEEVVSNNFDLMAEEELFEVQENNNVQLTEEISNSSLSQEMSTMDLSQQSMVNVKDYGAKGDGQTDDTAAIQKAINDSSAHKTILLIPETDEYYLISNTLYLKDNVHISGYGATIFMPSQDTPKPMFYSNEKNYISNVTFEGLALKSVNDREGTEYRIDSLTSHVQGIYILGIDTLTLKDVSMEEMYTGLKLGASLNGSDNINVNVDNLVINNSTSPLQMGATNGFIMTNSVLDADAGNSRWLHSAYLDWGNSNLLFQNTQFINAPGAGVNIGAGSVKNESPTDMIFENCSIENCNRGFNMYTTSNITVSNTSITKCNLAFAISNANKIDINNTEISEAKVDVANANIAKDKGAFYIDNSSQVDITDVMVDSGGMAGSLFNLTNIINDVTISNLTATNMNDIGFFRTNSISNNLTVENSNFEWTNITNPRLSFRGEGANATFRNNTFINKGKLYLAIADNYINTHIVMENNFYSGFKSLAVKIDYSTINNNLNLSNNVVDLNKGV